jgi:hypothetical protein
MEILLSIILDVVMIVFGVLLSPKLGTIPATLVISFVYFYYYIVFAAILGYAVYKCKNLLNR